MEEELKTILEVKDLEISFKGNNNEVTNFGSFEIKEGEFVLLKGINGSGKSTLLRLINLNFDGNNAYCNVKNGSITYIRKNGEKIESTSKNNTNVEFEELRKRIVEVRQDENFASTLTPYDALTHATILAIDRSDKSDEIKKERKEAMKKLIHDLFYGYELKGGIVFSLQKVLKNCSEREFSHKQMKAFSGGQQKMIQVLAGFVKAKITESNFILLDEPANNLDAQNKYYLNLLFKELMSTKKVAMLMISHCHVFDDISMIVDIGFNPEGGYIAKTIHKDDTNKELFAPHYDCISECEAKIKKLSKELMNK